MTVKLTPSDVVEIKRRLWNGERQTSVARAFNIAQPHVSRIANAEIYPHIPWPDGRTGPLPIRLGQAAANPFDDGRPDPRHLEAIRQAAEPDDEPSAADLLKGGKE